MKSIILFDPKDSAKTQVRFKCHFPNIQVHVASKIEDIFDYLNKKPLLIIMEAHAPKEDNGIIIGNKKIKSPFSVIQYLRKDYKFIIYTREKNPFKNLKIEVISKDIEPNNFKKIFSKYFNKKN